MQIGIGYSRGAVWLSRGRGSSHRVSCLQKRRSHVGLVANAHLSSAVRSASHHDVANERTNEQTRREKDNEDDDYYTTTRQRSTT